MNTAPAPTLAERLMKVPNGRLAVKLSLAHSAFARGRTTYERSKATNEIVALEAEILRRGLKASG